MTVDGQHSASVPYWTVSRIIAAFAACIFISVLGWKVLNSTFVVDLTTFKFPDFLSLVLAIFSIALALVFYLKASETSSAFYDNTYKFTAHVSEILGRIEAGFSERLRHLDEGYSRLGDRFDKIPFNFVKAEQQIAAEQELVDEKQKERDQLIDELIAKTALQDSEKADYLERLRIQESELEKARSEVQTLQGRLRRAEVNDDDLDIDRAFETLVRVANKMPPNRNIASKLLTSELKKGRPSVVRILVDREIIDDDWRLTDHGYDLIKSSIPRPAA